MFSKCRRPSASPKQQKEPSLATSIVKQLPLTWGNSSTTFPESLLKHFALMLSSLHPTRIKSCLWRNLTQLTTGLTVSPSAVLSHVYYTTGFSRSRKSHSWTPSPSEPPPVTTYWLLWQISTASPLIDVFPPIEQLIWLDLTSQKRT